MTDPAINFKTGRRPPTGAPSLKMSSLLVAGVLPEHPSFYDDGALDRYGWQMLGNDRYGDCVAVTWATQRRISSWAAGKDQYPSLDQVLQVYKTQNPRFPSQDEGMVIQDLLDYLHKTGGPDGVKVVAFAKVDHTNFEQMKAATYLGHQLWLGVNISDFNQQQFHNGHYWSITGPATGSHSVTATGYDALYIDFETWAKMGSLDQEFCVSTNTNMPCIEEAWLVVWPEQAASFNQAQRDAFQVAYGAVTGGKRIEWPVEAPPAVSWLDRLLAVVRRFRFWGS